MEILPAQLLQDLVEMELMGLPSSGLPIHSEILADMVVVEEEELQTIVKQEQEELVEVEVEDLLPVVKQHQELEQELEVVEVGFVALLQDLEVDLVDLVVLEQ